MMAGTTRRGVRLMAAITIVVAQWQSVAVVRADPPANAEKQTRQDPIPLTPGSKSNTPSPMPAPYVGLLPDVLSARGRDVELVPESQDLAMFDTAEPIVAAPGVQVDASITAGPSPAARRI